ncbi:MAG: hypothetical protein LKH04_03730 [Lachnospiraceae bacterium]|nr:hypothetical protein [Lachnospiraceae bacterium]MCI1397400.1 hypothetical protein [Lachnospiraceae bacterium]MCI1423401.1 hypothetical protein [Lachnospiraceae bacterium]MCI1452182.1 hypothetical protein [Lachnospiraceae bacterium]
MILSAEDCPADRKQTQEKRIEPVQESTWLESCTGFCGDGEKKRRKGEEKRKKERRRRRRKEEERPFCRKRPAGVSQICWPSTGLQVYKIHAGVPAAWDARDHRGGREWKMQ